MCISEAIKAISIFLTILTNIFTRKTDFDRGNFSKSQKKQFFGKNIFKNFFTQEICTFFKSAQNYGFFDTLFNL
jgi:hypothetical protein